MSPEPDPFHTCDVEKPRPVDAEKPYRAVLCNRPRHHTGPHRKIDPHTFARLHEWQDDER